MRAGSVRRAGDGQQLIASTALVLPNSSSWLGSPGSSSLAVPAASAHAELASSSAQPWWQRWWRRIADAVSRRAVHSVPHNHMRARWAGGDAAAAAAGRACGATPGSQGLWDPARRGARWLPFLPLRPRAPAAQRTAEAAALQELHSTSVQARISAGPPGPGALAGGAAGLHLVDLSQADDLGPGLGADAVTAALTGVAAAQPQGAAERAAVGSLQMRALGAPCEPVLTREKGAAVVTEGLRAPAGDSKHVLASPALAGTAGVTAGEAAAEARGVRSEPVLAAPVSAGDGGAGTGRSAARAAGGDTEPWAPFNESGLVPEVPPAIMWLIEEAEVRLAKVSWLFFRYCQCGEPCLCPFRVATR